MDRCPNCSSNLPSGVAVCPTCGAGIEQGLSSGTLLQGKYLIEEQLGQGVFGITYRATAVLLQMPVAIKEYFPQSAFRVSGRVSLDPEAKQGLQSFTLEAQAIARISHRGIVRVLDVFEGQGTAYVVMELLEGQTLEERIAEGPPLSPKEVTNIGLEVAEALSVVHQEGLLRGDLKPANIFLAKDRIVLIDFGLARELIQGKTVGHTRVLSPGYGSLEQAANEARLGPYTDIYALGATLYYALTGQPPPDVVSRTQGQILLAFPAKTPAALTKAITSALEMKACQRPADLAQWSALLREVVSPQPSAPAPTPPPPTPAPAPQHLAPAPAPQPAPIPLPSPSGAATTTRAGLPMIWFVVGALVVALGWLGLSSFSSTGMGAASLQRQTVDNSTASGGVQIVSIRFDGCKSEQGTYMGLLAGVASRCDLQVRYSGSGDLAKARFTYRLLYNQGGTTETVAVPGEDTWSPRGGNTSLAAQEGAWTFTVPLNVRKRPDRSYHTIVAVGELTLWGQVPLRFEQSIPVLQLPTNSQVPSRSVLSHAESPNFTSWYLDRCESESVSSSAVIAGETMTCYVVIGYQNSTSTNLSRADFAFSFESTDASGQVTTLPLSGTDTWTPGGGTVSLEDSGERWVFGVPVSVKYRENAPYQTLVVIGTLTFGNGTSKRVLERLNIEYPLR